MPAATGSLYERAGGHAKLLILVRNFYSTLQLDPLLGPIFARHVKHWPAHYARLADFWALQTGGPSAYRGQLIASHERIGVTPEHFARWLEQWRRSCRLHFAETEAAEMIALAERLAERMREAL